MYIYNKAMNGGIERGEGEKDRRRWVGEIKKEKRGMKKG
jgi:hypothetical protein